MEATVTEIHEYPARPAGYSEPLFGGPENSRQIMEHFLEASWLKRASEYAALSSKVTNVASGSGRALSEPWPVRVYRKRGLTVLKIDDSTKQSLRQSLGQRRKARRCGVRGGVRGGAIAIKCVIERWREVCEWWANDGGRDLCVYRVELSSGAVVDLARDRSMVDGGPDYGEPGDGEPGRWLLVGIPD